MPRKAINGYEADIETGLLNHKRDRSNDDNYSLNAISPSDLPKARYRRSQSRRSSTSSGYSSDSSLSSTTSSTSQSRSLWQRTNQAADRLTSKVIPPTTIDKSGSSAQLHRRAEATNKFTPHYGFVTNTATAAAVVSNLVTNNHPAASLVLGGTAVASRAAKRHHDQEILDYHGRYRTAKSQEKNGNSTARKAQQFGKVAKWTERGDAAKHRARKAEFVQDLFALSATIPGTTAKVVGLGGALYSGHRATMALKEASKSYAKRDAALAKTQSHTSRQNARRDKRDRLGASIV